MMTIFTFNNESDSRQWPATNDGVMGGISQGQSNITADGTLRFCGTVSLENNGGFVQISLDLDPDGKTVADFEKKAEKNNLPNLSGYRQRAKRADRTIMAKGQRNKE